MRKLMVAGLAVVWAMTGFAQNDVNFTAVEGYASIPLDGQNGWATEGGWIVDASGSGSAATATDDVRAVYGGDPIVLTGTDNAIRIRTDFSYDGTLADPSLNTVIGLFGVSSVAVTNWTGADADGTFLMATPGGTVVLRYESNTLNLSPTASMVTTDLTGDDLAVEYTVSLGSDAASSTFSAKLINVTDATETALGSYTGLEQNVFDAATTTGLNPMMWPGLFSINGTGITGVTVTSIAWETLEVLSGTTVDFVNPPYADGELNNQVFWNAQADMLVDTNATTVRTTTNFRRAISGGNALFTGAGGEGDSATIKADFYFEDVLAAENKIRANFGFTSDYANSQKIVIRTTPGGDLELRNDGNGVALGSIPIPGSNDALRITYTLTLGADAASSTMQAILLNTATSDEVTGSYAGIASDFYTAASTTNGALRFRYQNGEQNLPLVLDQVNFTEASVEPPPPAEDGCVDFTNPPYVDGQLNGQQFWSAPTSGSGFEVDTTATTVRRSLDWGAATYGSGKMLNEAGVAEGDSATVTVDFYFEGVMTNLNLIKARFGFTEDFSALQGFYLTSKAGGILRITDQNNINIGTSLPIPGADDPLQMTYTLTLGSNAASSVMSATLSNTVSAATASADYTGISSNLYTKATNGDGFWFKYSNGDLNGNTALVLDEFCLEDSIANPLSGFALFVANYGLDGAKTADGDLGGLNDWGEYVFGGIPTDGSDDAAKGSLPFFAATGDYTFALIGDDTVVAHVLTTDNLQTGTWVTNATVNVTATDGVVSNYTENVGTAGDQLFIQLFVE